MGETYSSELGSGRVSRRTQGCEMVDAPRMYPRAFWMAAMEQVTMPQAHMRNGITAQA